MMRRHLLAGVIYPAVAANLHQRNVEAGICKVTLLPPKTSLQRLKIKIYELPLA